jgi:hypothetical protein
VAIKPSVDVRSADSNKLERRPGSPELACPDLPIEVTRRHSDQGCCLALVQDIGIGRFRLRFLGSGGFVLHGWVVWEILVAGLIFSAMFSTLWGMA